MIAKKTYLKVKYFGKNFSWIDISSFRGLRNSEIRFEIGIKKTEPSRTELFMEFRKIRNYAKFQNSDIFRNFNSVLCYVNHKSTTKQINRLQIVFAK